MELDLRAMDLTGLTAQVCVVGAGATGLALAHALLDSGLDVVLVESGGAERDPASEALNEVDSMGTPRLNARSARARGLGGSTRLWAGQCVPLGPEDFVRRPWVPGSGWPLTLADLDPYYRRAEAFLGIPGARYDQVNWAAHRLTAPPFDPAVIAHRFTVYPRTVDLGRAHRAALARSATVRVLLNATVTRVVLRDGSDAATGVELAAPGGRRVRLDATVTVLCAGGIENARILLLSGLDGPATGRYLQEHPNLFAAAVHASDPRELQDRYALLYRRGRRFFPRMALAAERQRADAVLNCTAALVFEHPPAVTATKEVVRALRARRRPTPAVFRDALRGLPGLPAVALRRYGRGLSPGATPLRIRLQVFSEQAPAAGSRVSLSEHRDALGQPRASVQWRLSEHEVRTVRAMVRAVAEQLALTGLGRVEPEPWLDDDAAVHLALRDAFHHMGTTRMALRAEHGVVDPEGRVHGVGNLYAAGTSTFPTSGWANPTLTGIALGIRLADHLRRRFGA